MKFLNAKTCGSAMLLLAVIGSVLFYQHRAAAQDGIKLPPQRNGVAGTRHSANYSKNHELQGEALSQELLLRHRFYGQRFTGLGDQTPFATNLAAPIVTDVDDVSVVRDDGSLVIPRKLFNLVGRTVTFTPSGSSYTVTGSATPGYDTDFGTKLDLSMTPAVNPSVQADPGDDAYIEQTLGFTFNYYGTAFTSVGVSSNGFLTFRTNTISSTQYDNDSVDSGESLTDLQTRSPRIAPYWHDLDGRPGSLPGAAGVYIRKAADRVVVTWHNVPDFPNNEDVDDGIHRFQATLFRDGRIVFAYDQVQLTTMAITGVTPGLLNTSQPPTQVDFANPPATAFSGAVASSFTVDTAVDLVGAIRAFYNARPGRDVYDFTYFMTDFDFDLGGGFAFYAPVSNNVSGINEPLSNNTALKSALGSQNIQGVLNLNNILTAYPLSPAERLSDIIPGDSALSIWAQEQGHRWLAALRYPGSEPGLLLGRDEQHWNYFMSIESSMSTPAARRSSGMEGNVWRENTDGSFTTISLVDGYSRLDQYAMGLRPASDVNTPMFVIKNAVPSISQVGRDFTPFPGVRATGTKQAVTIEEIIQANGQRMPASTAAPKNFRAAFILLTQGAQPAPTTLAKLKKFRLAWESYFGIATDFLATINTGLADASNGARVIAAASGANFRPTLAPGMISSIFGQGLAAGITAATTQPLPTTLGGVQVLVDGVAAPLFFVSPGQINFQIPTRTTAVLNETFIRNFPSKTCLVEVMRDGQLARAGVFTIASTVPGLFTLNASGTGAAAAVDAVTGTGAPFNATLANGNPNVLSLFGTGLGADGTDTDGNVNSTVQIRVGTNNGTVLYAGRTPGFTGLNQYNVTLPAGLTSGTHNVIVTRNGIEAPPVTIAIK